MNKGLTGGQFSLVRALFGIVLLWTFATTSQPIPPSESASFALKVLAPFLGTTSLPDFLIGVGLAAAMMIFLGWQRRFAAWLVFFLLPWQHPIWPGNFMIGPLSLIAFLMILHPPAPYGSLAAENRVDPGGGWRQPPSLKRFSLFLLVIYYLFTAFMLMTSQLSSQGTQIVEPTGILDWTAAILDIWQGFDLLLGSLSLGLIVFFLITLASWKTKRFLAWACLAIWLAVLGLAGYPLWGLWVLHLLALDVDWRPADAKNKMDIVFYDGYCGMCHRVTRFAMAEDEQGILFQYAPLQGPTLSERLDEEQIASLPDSVVLLRENGELLTKSNAALTISRRLGGYWRILASLGFIFPTVFRDWVYDGIAAVRHKIFKKPDETCPLLPPKFRQRMLP